MKIEENQNFSNTSRDDLEFKEKSVHKREAYTMHNALSHEQKMPYKCNKCES